MSSTNAFIDVTLLPELEISVDFDLGGHRLIPGYTGELGEPIEAFLELYAVKDGAIAARILTPDDLSRLGVTILTAPQALSFVKLFTLPETYYLFNKVETVIELSVIPDPEPPGVGKISESKFQAISMSEPQVTSDKQAFTVERNLIRCTSLSGTRDIIRRTERVSTIGAYTLVSEHSLAQLNTAELQIPYYE